MEHVRERVAAETGFRLRSEVRLVGFGNRTRRARGVRARR